jgi:D-proline reductase (dithiol) PrdB
MAKEVNSYRFLDFISRKLVDGWAAQEHPAEIPWTPLNKPLPECKLAVISSAGMALKSDRPFDQSIERTNPWACDPSLRLIPRETTGEEINIYHLHINPAYALQDINCVLPVQHLAALESAGEIGELAKTQYSFMGYNPQPRTLLEESVPAMINQLRAEQVDAVLLVPV